jgi:hypothetical protein
MALGLRWSETSLVAEGVSGSVRALLVWFFSHERTCWCGRSVWPGGVGGRYKLVWLPMRIRWPGLALSWVGLDGVVSPLCWPDLWLALGLGIDGAAEEPSIPWKSHRSRSSIAPLSACPPSLFGRHVHAAEHGLEDASFPFGLATLPVMWARRSPFSDVPRCGV